MTGPSVVALGGGHGLAASLRAARSFAGCLVGIVSVADDGGSSGQLRRELGLPAPGDLRRCLTALAPDDSLLARSLEHRFERGALEGHPLGNLLIAGLAGASGDFEAAIAEVARLIGAVGTIYPATSGPVTLMAESDEGPLYGQVTIEHGTNIKNLRLDCVHPRVPAAALDAIAHADQVILGPGSLYTSVLATLIVPPINEALSVTGAQKVFVANVANDRAAARGFDLPEHLAALGAYGIEPDVVVAQDGTRRVDEVDLPVVSADMAADDGWGHDPQKLGVILSGLLAR